MRDEPQLGAEIGGYRLESVIARGGMGVVYLAEDVRMGRTVALKLLPAELAENERFRARFLHESRVAGAVNHPNVIPVYDAGETDGLLYISMRYVEGTDLRGLLQTSGPLELQRAVSIVSQAASALAAIHQRGLIHRDVKPANMLLVPRASHDGADHVYLTDFGLAKNLGSLSGLTKTGQFMGTVGYVAPEQIRGKGVDKRTDVYALGCVLFECLTGLQPFRRKDDFATIMAHVNDAPPLVSELAADLPEAIDEVVGKALAKDAQDRFAGCDELGSALRRAAGSPTGITPPPDAPRPAPSSKGSVWLDAEPLSPSRTEAAYDATRADGLDDDPTAGTVVEGAGSADESAEETRWEEELPAAPAAGRPAAGRDSATAGQPPPPPSGPSVGSPAQPPPSTARAPRPARNDGPASALARLPLGARVLLGLVVVGCIVALAVVLLGGGDGDEQAAAPAPPAAAPPTDAGPAQDSSPWRPVTSSPSARQQVATAVLSGRISLIGGLVGKDTATATAEVESYDPAIDTWNTAPSLPRPLHHATAVGYRGELVVIGGWEPEGSNLTAKTSGAVLALRNGRWVRLASLRHARAAGAAAVVDDKIVVVGGQANGALVPATEIYDGKKWRDGAPLPTPREHLAAASDGRFVYAVGGRKRSSDRNTAALERYDATADSWRKLTPLPKATGSMGAAIVGRQLVVVGGEGASQLIKNVQSYNLDSGRWSQLAAMRTPRHGLGVASFGTTLYALDGAKALGHLQSTSTAEALELG